MMSRFTDMPGESRRQQLAASCLVVMLALGSVSALAQDDNQEQRAPESSSESGQPEAQHEQEEQQQTEEATTPSIGRSSAETFTPSEEISEDLSVSFPADI